MYTAGMPSRDWTSMCVPLNGDAKRGSIVQALTQALGMEVKFEALPEQDAPRPSENMQEDTLLAELKESFGGENVTVQEK